MTEKKIKVNWLDKKSIKNAERLKSKYENEGYRLKTTWVGFQTMMLVYEKPKKSKLNKVM